MDIKTKMLIPELLITFIVGVAILVGNIVLFSGFVDETTRERVDSASEVVKSSLEFLKSDAKSSAQSIAKDSDIIQAVQEQDRSALLAHVRALQEEAGVEFCTVTDAQGIVLMRAHAPEEYGDSIADQANVQSALYGRSLTAVESGSVVRLSVRSGTPIVDSEDNIIGVISAGYRLDTDSFVDSIKAMMGCETTVFLDNERVSTTVLMEDGTRALGTTLDERISTAVLAGNSYTGRVDILDRPAVVNVTYVEGPDTQAVGMILVGEYVEEEFETIRAFLQVGLIITIIMLAFSAGIIMLLVRRIVMPIQAMTKAASALADGETDLDIQVSTKDEMRTLADAFNSMIENTRHQVEIVEHIADGEMTVPLRIRSEKDVMNRALEKLNTTIQEQAATLKEDMREQQKMMDEIESRDQQLQAALEEAKRANSAKGDFLASMSHEMRTPLNAIIGLSEITLDDAGLNEDARSNLEKVYSSGTTLLGLVNDILDISKIQSGKFTIIPGEYDIPSLINDSILQNVLRIGSRPIRFALQIDADIPARLYGDELRIRQVINNLLSNAFKYTEKGTVTFALRCERDGDTVWMNIHVSDTGVGLKPEHIENLFADYEQFGATSYHQAGGTGLGLAITKKLTEMMDGTIKVESDYGKGSMFKIRIRQQYVNSDIIGPEVVESLKRFEYSTVKLDRYAQVNRVAMPYAHVLLVDDNTTNLAVAKGLLKPYGMQIDCVTSGQDAVRAVREEKVYYSAIFMDHMMPGMDGIEATRIIREDLGTDYGKNIPIIALTANALAGNEAMFLSKGFQAFISKPIDIEKLDAVLRKWIRRQEAEAEGAEGAGAGRPAAAVSTSTQAAAAYKPGPEAGRAETPVSKPVLARGTEAGREHLHFTAPEARVLIAEDNEVNQKVVLGLLRPLQLQLDTADNGAEALKMIQESRYHMIFMDHMMPVMDGIEATKRLRQLEGDYYKAVPVLALTADDADARDSFIQAGMNDLVSKPIDMKEICAKIRRWLPPELLQEQAVRDSIQGQLLIEALKKLASAMNSFDLDSADKALEQIEALTIPVECQAHLELLRSYMADVAMQEVIDLTQTMIELIESMPKQANEKA